MIPEFIQEVIRQQNLQVDHIIRNGPRYFVAVVRRADEKLILKALVRNDTWTNPRTGAQFCTANLFEAEIAALSGLGDNHDLLAGRVPRLLAHQTGRQAWTLREQVAGKDMSGSAGSMIFHEDFYRQVDPERLAEYILSYQDLTPKLLDAAATTPQTNRSSLIVADFDFPQTDMKVRSAQVNKYVSDRALWHDSWPKVLAHGEVYPPHIFVQNEHITLIDWENFGLCNPVSDPMQVWVRAYGNPDWQDNFRQAIWRGLKAAPADVEELWNIEKIYQSSRNLIYLYYSEIELPEQKAMAAESFTRNIQEVLAIG